MKLVAAITVLLAAQLVAAPPPKLVREIDLNQIIPGRPGYLPFAYFAFSPDEKWLAVTVGALPVDPRKRRPNGRQVGAYTLLLVPVKGPANQQVQIDPGLRPLASPGWSPSSDTFFVPGLAANARNRRTDGIVKVWSLRGEELFAGPCWISGHRAESSASSILNTCWSAAVRPGSAMSSKSWISTGKLSIPGRFRNTGGLWI